MKRFLPAPWLPELVVGFLSKFVPKLEEELDRLEEKIPEKVPTHDEIREELLNDPDFLDSVYRYIKRREERNNG